MIIKENILKLLQKQNDLPEYPYIPNLTSEMCIDIKQKKLVNNGDSYKINIEVVQRAVNDSLFNIMYKEIHDYSTDESWITEFSGYVKSDSIRANIIRYDDITGNNQHNYRGHETYFLYSNMLLKFKYGSNQGDFFRLRTFTPEQFIEIKKQYRNMEITKMEAEEIMKKEFTSTSIIPTNQ